MCNNLSDPTKLVCYTEVSAIKGVCYIRGSTVYPYAAVGTCQALACPIHPAIYLYT